MFDPALLIDAMGPTTLIMAIVVRLKVAAKRRKISMAPAVSDHSNSRNPATGLPLDPPALLAMDLGRVMLMFVLVVCSVVVPNLLLIVLIVFPCRDLCI